MEQLVKQCNFCDNPESKVLYKENPHLVKCTKCGLVYSTVQMDVESMKKFYNEEYFISTDSVRRGYTHYFNDKKNILKTFRVIRYVLHFCLRAVMDPGFGYSDILPCK